MGIFWRALAGSLAGRLLGALFIAVCIAFGVGPERWAAFMIADLPVWITPTVARAVFLSFAALTGLALWRQINRRPTGDLQSVEVLSNAAPTDNTQLHGYPGSDVWMTALDLVTHIVDRSAWALGMGMDRETLLEHPGGYLVREIQRVSKNGDLASIGRKNGKGVHEQIPATFWFSSTIDVRSLFGPDAAKMGRTRPAGSEREAEIIVEEVPYYSDLRFNRADVYRAWPRQPTQNDLTHRV